MEADAARQHSTKFHHHRCGCSDSDVDICFARAIFGQDCPLVWHYFQQLAIHGNVGTDVISVVLNDVGPSMLTPMMFALALATSGLSGLAVRCCCPHHLVSHHHFPCLNSYTGFQLITESNLNCPLLHIVLLQYINHLILQVSCTFLTSPDNSDHLPHSSFLFPELNWTWASVLSLLLHPSFGMNSQPLWNLVKVLHLSVKI